MKTLIQKKALAETAIIVFVIALIFIGVYSISTAAWWHHMAR